MSNLNLTNKIKVGLTLFGLAGLATCSTIKTINDGKETTKEMAQSKKIIKKANLEKYVEILESPDAKNAEVWHKAAKQIQDSLKIDSIARTNYAKGQQMIRDSIKKAALSDSTKILQKLH